MLSNLKPLVADMKRLGWMIDGFLFSFNNHRYYVLVLLYQHDEAKPQYALAKLKFIDSQNTNRTYVVHANSRDLIDLDVKSFREFFHIPFGNSLSNVIKDFIRALGIEIPTEFKNHKEDSIKSTILDFLVRSDPQNPNKKYCIGVRRNKQGESRSDFNDNKARLLVPNVYHHFANDKTLSFSFSENPDNKKGENEIIKSFLDR